MTSDAVLVRPHWQHVPPVAVALAIVLHVAAGLAIWWIPSPTPKEPEEEPIMVMFDSSPSNIGLQSVERPGPPAESVAASPPPEPSQPEQQQALASPPPATPPAPAAEQAPSLPLYEFSIPPVASPPPPPTSRDFLKPSRPPLRPAQRAPILPRRPPAQQRPPTDLPAVMPSPLPGPEPGDVLAGRGRQRNDDLSRIFRHLAPYRFSPRTAGGEPQHGRVVTRVTVARDGRVIDVRLDTSSGRPALDAAEIAAIRKASPFPPLPASMPGDPVVLVLPINY